MYRVRREHKLHQIRDLTFSACVTACAATNHISSILCAKKRFFNLFFMKCLSRRYLTNDKVGKEAKSNTLDLH